MSTKRKKNTRTARPTPRNEAATDRTQHAPTTPARTDTESKLWAALVAHPGSTTAQLASQAGIGASTAGKALARWLSGGHVARTPGAVDDDGSGKRRTAGTWTITEPAAESALAAADATKPDTDATDNGSTGTLAATVTADDNPATATATATTPTTAPGPGSPKARTGKTGSRSASKPGHNTNGAPKLRSGELRGQVEDHLREHPAAEFSPVEIGNKLGRSSGAVANVLEKLTEAGVAQRTSNKPKRYQLAADAADG